LWHGLQWQSEVRTVKESAPPFGGPPADEAPDGPPVPDDSAPEEDGPPKDEGEDKPKDEKGGEKGMEHMLSQIFDMMTKMTDALGLSDPSGPVPGMDEGPAPDGPPAPPSGKPGVDASGKQHVVHERSLKPGEAPPGTTPIGSPSFAHVKGHPWEEDIRQGAKEILLEDVQGDDSIGVIASELRGLAEPVGYRVEQITPFDRGGVRHVRAKVVKV
jgi:hypothetical protein